MRVRRKLADAGLAHAIVNLRGAGYRLAAAPEHSTPDPTPAAITAVG